MSCEQKLITKKHIATHKIHFLDTAFSSNLTLYCQISIAHVPMYQKANQPFYIHTPIKFPYKLTNEIWCTANRIIIMLTK